MSYAGADRHSAAIGYGAKWFLFRLSIYAAVAVVSAGLFLVGASLYAFLYPSKTPSPPIVIELPAPADMHQELPPIRLPSGQDMVQFRELELTAEDGQFILSIINPRSSTAARKYSLGDAPPGHLLPLLPAAIIAKIPRLRGYRYDVDSGGNVFIVDPATYRISAIIAPN